MAAYDYGLRSVIGAIAGMDIIQVHDNITMILHNIHTDLVSTGNASHSVPECGFEGLKTYQAPAHMWDLPRGWK